MTVAWEDEAGESSQRSCSTGSARIRSALRLAVPAPAFVLTLPDPAAAPLTQVAGTLGMGGRWKRGGRDCSAIGESAL